MWLFALGVIEEFLFASGIYGSQLVKSYLGIVALLVQFLALGSIQLVQSHMVKRTYYLFALISSVALSYLLLDANIGNVLTDYVVYGELPVTVIVISSVITFPAATVLIWTAVRTFRRDKDRKMLSIVAGVVVVSIAGSLYIVQFPSFLYVSEFIGILLLWVGFFDFSSRKRIVSSQEELRQQRLH